MQTKRQDSQQGLQRFRVLLHQYRALSKEERDDVNRCRFQYYQPLVHWILTLICPLSILYYISDCQLNGEFPTATLLPRVAILLPFALYEIIEPRIKDYRKVIVCNYLLAHAIVWCTIGAIVFLKNRTHASEGFAMMDFVFLGICFSAAPRTGIPLHLCIFVDLMISNTFIHYQNLGVMLSLLIPCSAVVCGVHVAMSLLHFDHYQMQKKLEHAMRTDPLTQVHNRHELERIVQDDRLIDHWYKGSQAQHSVPVAVVMLDIDLFKQINDQYGHYTGDIVLAYLGRVLMEYTKQSGIVVRYGGEEFLVLLANRTAEQAKREFDAINCAIMLDHAKPVNFHVSGGTANYEGSIRKAIDQADCALYTAKRNGRNQFVQYVPGQENELLQ